MPELLPIYHVLLIITELISRLRNFNNFPYKKNKNHKTILLNTLSLSKSFSHYSFFK